MLDTMYHKKYPVFKRVREKTGPTGECCGDRLFGELFRGITDQPYRLGSIGKQVRYTIVTKRA